MKSSPFDYWRTGFELAQLGVEASSVVWMRMMGLAGVWNTPFDESWRMMREKPGAFVEATGRGVEAMLRGQPPASVVSATVAPLNRHAATNRRRLARRGPQRRR
ncbi:antifreeze protein [Rhodophyticola porphyridii]|uniref:Antifreeze protein n=1 Tax=Rhodophyticola porphyridii TaxID=1852017 RepID=A0A3L9Y0S8_9RHOB|nr:antifreeze protein [Rhodophyticola porphyridii]RMA42072.1 antifreeze protein [Rhodophyticola porphyridii]